MTTPDWVAPQPNVFLEERLLRDLFGDFYASVCTTVATTPHIAIGQAFQARVVARRANDVEATEDAVTVLRLVTDDDSGRKEDGNTAATFRFLAIAARLGPRTSARTSKSLLTSPARAPRPR